eukprot:TRINITY_DN55557_c0_g1_i1.p1 TRINITY_DN55557_c0_g1~~TRINITY_DN55557_c0_g1_i1.p1  ORF type:complete len:314 (+),score=125.24 TRINITY_DN55557_c0_g1_i1:82-942(+)
MAAAQPPMQRRRLTTGEELVAKLTAGSIAGVVGVSACYPIDFAKTRLQQHPGKYAGIGDVLRKVSAQSGVRALYDGLRPNLTGIIPEKGLKLAVFDFVRVALRDPDGSIPLQSEVKAAISAAVAQVVVTTPMELVKIRCQLTGRGAFDVMKELGLRGMYKGYVPTLSRDVWFNLWFFPLQAQWKAGWIKEDDPAGVKLGKSFTAGITAGMLAAALSTPFDVIKTRMQAGEGAGIVHTARSIAAKEGFGAFFLGWQPRVYAIAPLFGIAIAVYDVQKRWLLSMGYDL